MNKTVQDVVCRWPCRERNENKVNKITINLRPDRKGEVFNTLAGKVHEEKYIIKVNNKCKCLSLLRMFKVGFSPSKGRVYII